MVAGHREVGFDLERMHAVQEGETDLAFSSSTIMTGPQTEINLRASREAGAAGAIRLQAEMELAPG
jgi:hypothetical protein